MMRVCSNPLHLPSIANTLSISLTAVTPSARQFLPGLPPVPESNAALLVATGAGAIAVLRRAAPAGRCLAIACLAVLLVASGASWSLAAEVRIDNQGLDSVGNFGEPGNGSASANYSGPTTIFTEMNFLGRWRRVLDESRIDETFFQITNVTQGYEFPVQIATDEDGEFDDSTSVLIGATPQLLVFAQQNDEFRFEAFEDIDDGPGADARWDQLTRLVLREHVGGIGSPPTPLIDLGSFDAGALSIDTLGSTMDTSIALYGIDGKLLGENDDEFTDPRFFGDDEFASLINADLIPGDYVLALGGASTDYGDGFAIPSDGDVFELSEGSFNLNMGGNRAAFGRLEGEGRMQSYRFTVVDAIPEPSGAVLGVSAAALLMLRSPRRTAMRRRIGAFNDRAARLDD